MLDEHSGQGTNPGRPLVRVSELGWRDVTPEAVERVATKMIPGFGELFRHLSFAKIGTSTVQTRACACVARGTYIFALPGSTGAVKDGWDGILADQLDSRHRPCNFVELMPRLTER